MLFIQWSIISAQRLNLSSSAVFLSSFLSLSFILSLLSILLPSFLFHLRVSTLHLHLFHSCCLSILGLFSTADLRKPSARNATTTPVTTPTPSSLRLSPLVNSSSIRRLQLHCHGRWCLSPVPGAPVLFSSSPVSEAREANLAFRHLRRSVLSPTYSLNAILRAPT